MTDNDYVRRRLERMAGEALLKAQIAVNAVQADATLKGALGNSRVYLFYDEAVGKVLEEALPRMAVTAFRASGGTSDAAAGQLESAGLKYVHDICDWLQKRYKNESAFGVTGPPISALKNTLCEMVRNAVDDFHHGMAGEESLKQDPVVSIVTNITNSSGAVVQNAVGQNNQQSAQQQSLLGALDKLVTSEEFKALDEQNRLALQDIADVLREEIRRPAADTPKVARWGRRLIGLAEQLGLHVAGAEIAKYLFGA